MMDYKKFCFACGEQIDTRAEICVKCGVRQQGSSLVGKKSRATAILLALFLGVVGAHKYYLNQIGLGILYTLFFWTCIPAFIAFIELILLILMSDERFNQKFNK